MGSLQRLAYGTRVEWIAACLAAHVSMWVPTPVVAQAITIDLPMRVSPPGTGNHWFSMIDAAPGNAAELIACGIRSMPVTNTRQGFLYHSDDGGFHWATAMVDSTPDRLSSEEACAFGPDGQAYFIAETWNDRHEIQRFGYGILRLYRSLDYGRTWALGIVDPTYSAWMDYARLAVDRGQGPHRGRVYIFSNPDTTGLGNVHSSTGAAAYPMRYSLDAGVHFGDRVMLPVPVGLLGGYPNSALVTPTGTVIAAYVNIYAADGLVSTQVDTTKPILLSPARRRLVQIARSLNSGVTLELPVTVAAVVYGHAFPTMAVDASSGAYSRRLYLAWDDTVGGTYRIFATTSDDDGKTWTKPRIVDDWTRVSRKPRRVGFGRYGALNPRIAVNRDGTIGLTWMEDDECARFAASLDGGRSFLPSVTLNPCPRREQAAFAIAEHLETTPLVEPVDHVGFPDLLRKGFTIWTNPGGGAYGLTADADGVFHPLWSISGTDGRLWTTRVVVHGADSPKTRSHPASIAGLKEVSAQVTFTFTNQDYDLGLGTVALDMRLINIDSVPIHVPIVAQLTRLQSGLFHRVEVVNADNGEQGIGAEWDFSAKLLRGELGPYARSDARRLSFRLSGGSGHFDLLAQPGVPLLVADVKIFAASP